uniref:hypothetical protein n=1 Tax=Roseivirga sp. TaxID=1964215 RepID=UPI0040489980
MKNKEEAKPIRKVKKEKTPDTQEAIKVDNEELPEDEFDFGGFPKNIPLKRNIGCGG